MRLKVIMIMAALAVSALGASAGRADVTVCYDVFVTAAGTEVVNQEGCEVVDTP